MSCSYTHIKIIVAIIVIIGLFGCRTQQPIQNHDYRDSVYIERYIRDTLPADTSYIVTLIECDSMTHKPIVSLSDVYVDDLKLWVRQKQNNVFEFGAIRLPDKIKIIQQSNSSDKLEIVEVERKRSKFEWFLLSSGVFAWLIIITYLIIKIYKLIKI